MKILAFDQASQKTGWAFGDPVVRCCGTINTAARRLDSIGSRFLRLETGVNELLDRFKPEVVVIEEHQRHKGTWAAQMLGGALAIITKCTEARKIDLLSVPVKTLKKSGSGTVSASKELMLAVARKKFPQAIIKSDDEADACLMVEWAAKELHQS